MNLMPTPLQSAESLSDIMMSMVHIAVNFVTNLPNFHGFTMILVAVKCFSKACKLAPLKGLPTAMETARTVLTIVF